MAVYDCLKRYVLRSYLNVSRDDEFYIWSIRLFHAVGPAIEKKEQRLNFLEDRGTCRRFFDKDSLLLP